jgi:hypothetical protein
MPFANFVTSKAGARHELLFNKLSSGLCGGFVEHLKSDLSSKTKCDQNHSSAFANLVTPKAGAKHELLFKKLAEVVLLIISLT